MRYSSPTVPTSNRRLLALAIMAAALLAWAADCFAQEPPKPDATALWKHITTEDNYKKWGTWKGFGELKRSKDPNGFYRRIFVNSKALNVGDKQPLPPGSIIVREGYGIDFNTYAPTSDIVAYTVMYKVEGYNPKAGDWFWAHYGGAGQVINSGIIDKCIKCHNTAKTNDWVLEHDLGLPQNRLSPPKFNTEFDPAPRPQGLPTR